MREARQGLQAGALEGTPARGPIEGTMRFTCLFVMLCCALVGAAALVNGQYVLAAVNAVLFAVNVVVYRTLRRL